MEWLLPCFFFFRSIYNKVSWWVLIRYCTCTPVSYSRSHFVHGLFFYKYNMLLVLKLVRYWLHRSSFYTWCWWYYTAILLVAHSALSTLRVFSHKCLASVLPSLPYIHLRPRVPPPRWQFSHLGQICLCSVVPKYAAAIKCSDVNVQYKGGI